MTLCASFWFITLITVTAIKFKDIRWAGRVVRCEWGGGVMGNSYVLVLKSEEYNSLLNSRNSLGMLLKWIIKLFLCELDLSGLE
jgi:hypothetical protein